MQMDDTKVEIIVGRLLQAGVLLAAAIVLFGGVLYLREAAGQMTHYHTFRGVAEPLKSIGGVVKGAIALDAQSVIQLGLLVLIATPIARVAFSIVAFALERDWLYVGLTFVVFGVLMYSLLQST
jgi:uncharacterized membrane protein